ncbi:hypothetical protein D1007_48673 [Hordeum vulgare]|nr:hypothetical protein D1007_48673 [Hordeum vulgare]
MRTLRHHLLMEEDRKKSQGKEKNSYTAEIHLGEHKNQGNKRNFQRKKDGTDLREKINRKRDREYRKESDGRRDKGDRWNDQSKQKFDKKNYKCHSCGEFGHFRSECSKRKKPNDRKGNSNDQDNRKGNLSPEGSSA